MASTLTRQYSAYLQRAGALYERPQIRASVEIILSVFSVSLLVFFAIRPTLVNIASLQKKIEDQEVVLKKADLKLGQLIRAETQLSENQDKLQLLVDAVPNTFDYFNISKRIEIVARENSVELKFVNLPGSVIIGGQNIPGLAGELASEIVRPSETGLITIPVGFSANGTQPQLLGFINGLEKMEMLGVIQDIRLSKETTAIGQNNLLNLSGTAWFYSMNTNK